MDKINLWKAHYWSNVRCHDFLPPRSSNSQEMKIRDSDLLLCNEQNGIQVYLVAT